MNRRYTTTEIALQGSTIARDSDWDLYFAVFELEGAPVPLELQNKLRHCSMPETISRTRRTLQHRDGLYPASQAVEDQRFDNYERAKHSRGETVTALEQMSIIEEVNNM